MNETTTRLLTLLNTSALKRKKPVIEPVQSPKLNKRKKVVVDESVASPSLAHEERKENEQMAGLEGANEEEEENHVDDEKETEALQTVYKQHFGPETKLLNEAVRDNVDNNKWNRTIIRRGKLGVVSLSIPEDGKTIEFQEHAIYIPEKLHSAHKERAAKLLPNHKELQADILSTLSRYQDLFLNHIELEHHSLIRDATTLHALNHIFNIRRRILKNNERISHAKSASSSFDPPPDIQDQGFTRPSILILTPFRSHALDWALSLLSHLPSHQVENRARLQSEFSLPTDAIDKVAEAEEGTYPKDHVAMFKGNIDDNFRVGIKVTKKAVKCFAGFYQCDLILASPLGLRMIIEKDKNADFLSSIEVLVMDQLDALTMQNWEHVQFVLARLNLLPKEAHDADFSRIKPWYLDQHAINLRQSILLSSYETPAMRALFNHHLKNVAGKIRTEKRWKAVAVPEEVDQIFSKFSSSSPKSEPDKRFEFFTKDILPSVLKSAVQSSNTLIFIPSSFDFIRVQNHFRKLPDSSLAILSEYSSNSDISRARQAFFSGKKHFLLMSERFHFFRRYKIRGVRNIIFYGLPDHREFFTEILSFPFLDEGVEPADVTCRSIYCRYDATKLERIVGSERAADMVRE